MEQARLTSRSHCSGSTPSDESSLDLEKYCFTHSYRPSFSPPSIQIHALAGQHCESIRRGVLTSIPAILVFVSRKVHKQWLTPIQCLPTALEGPGGVWCDVDVVEFSYFGAPEPTSKEQLYTAIVDDLRGSDPFIGSGSQVANQETYGTLGAIVRSQTGNRRVAVDLDYPNQKMFHPLPPTLGPRVYLGAVERATSFIRDLWFGIFADINPVAVQEQRAASMVGLTAGDSSPPDIILPNDKYKPLSLKFQHVPLEEDGGGPDIDSSPVNAAFDLEEGVNSGPSFEHQFIPTFNVDPIMHHRDNQQR